MEKIRISIDCDGVLRDFDGQIIKLAAKEGVYLSRPTAWDYLKKNIGERSIECKLWKTKEWLEPVFEGAPVLPFAKKGYNHFIEDPLFEVYIVTSQRKGTEKNTDIWLEKNGFNKHKETQYFYKKTKAPCQILIDDNEKNVQSYVDAAREAYLMISSHNLGSTFEPKVENLYDAYKTIKERYQGKK